MLIKTMTCQACVDLLKRTRIARLACANEGQSYITPMSFVYDGNCLYSFSTVGQKITWMRANPLVCVEADELVIGVAKAGLVIGGLTGGWRRLPISQPRVK